MNRCHPSDKDFINACIQDISFIDSIKVPSVLLKKHTGNVRRLDKMAILKMLETLLKQEEIEKRMTMLLRSSNDPDPEFSQLIFGDYHPISSFIIERFCKKPVIHIWIGPKVLHMDLDEEFGKRYSEEGTSLKKLLELMPIICRKDVTYFEVIFNGTEEENQEYLTPVQEKARSLLPHLKDKLELDFPRDGWIKLFFS